MISTSEGLRHGARRTAAALLLLAGALAGGVSAQDPGQDPGAVLSVCSSCHEELGPERIRALQHADSVSCLTCHHVGFTNDPTVAAERRLETCRSCHEDVWPTHDSVEVAADAPTCTACHTIHGEPPLGDDAAALTDDCRACHEAPHALHATTDPIEAPECGDCHTLHTEALAYEGDPAVTEACRACHEAPHPGHADLPADEAPACTTCHGLGPDDPALPEPETTAASCSVCHDELHPTHAAVEEDAPECADCHDYADDPPLDEARPTLALRCAECHEEALTDLRGGGHAGSMDPEEPNPDLPTCVTCHPTHEAATTTPGKARLAATVRCIDCHAQDSLIERYQLPENVTRSYTEDFHGATVQFLWAHPTGEDEDQPPVMVCADCHGGHAVGWAEGAEVAPVCLECHDRGDPQLAGAWLGHGRITPQNQPVIWLIRLFYYVMIPFVLVGLGLHIWFHLRDQQRKGARMFRAEGLRRLLARLRGEEVEEPRTVTRFGLADRAEHLGSMLTFVLLVATGLPQTRPDLDAAQAVIGFFGGIAATRFVHRVVGFVFVVLLVVHVGRAIVAALRKRRLPIMVPTRKDFEDALETLKHFVFGTPRPKSGKFDFAQKFEYWGLFLGGTLMSVTGVVLVWPELLTQVLPGIVVAAVRTVHGLEATFAVLVVVIWHTYSVILRPEIFPLDTSIFTGQVEVERLKEEHGLEYERLFPREAAREAAREGRVGATVGVPERTAEADMEGHPAGG